MKLFSFYTLKKIQTAIILKFHFKRTGNKTGKVNYLLNWKKDLKLRQNKQTYT